MNYQAITDRYYAAWCGMDYESFVRLKGIRFIESPSRDLPLKGYNKPRLVYVYKDSKKLIISYSPTFHQDFEAIKEQLSFAMDLRSIHTLLAEKLKRNTEHLALFCYDGILLNLNLTSTRALVSSDYETFLNYFKQENPEATDLDWLPDYYGDISSKGFVYGTFEKGRLASVSDAPDMPFMEGKIQHTGISTLPQYRGQGYAKKTAYASTRGLIEKGICPQWECDADNLGSIHTALSLGYRLVADVLVVL